MGRRPRRRRRKILIACRRSAAAVRCGIWRTRKIPIRSSAAHRARTNLSLEKNRVGMISFLISEGVFFLMLILAYLFYNSHAMNGPTPADTLNPQRTGIYTLCLLASSLTIWLAEKKLKARKHSAFRWLLALTILLGAVFIVRPGPGISAHFPRRRHGQFQFVRDHLFHPDRLSRLACVRRRDRVADSDGTRAWPAISSKAACEAVKSIGLYWHFVDAVWLVVFSVIYLRLLL